MKMYLPIALIVLSNIFYHLCTKSAPKEIDPFASLTVTYLVGAVCSAALFFLFHHGGSLWEEYHQLNPSVWILGIAIVGLEAGALLMYRAGWNISTGQMVYSALLTVCLAVIGVVFYHEEMNLFKLAGIVLCMAGVILINR